MERSEKELVEAARAVRENAYAPFSKFKVGAALETDDGQIIVGGDRNETPLTTTGAARISADGVFDASYSAKFNDATTYAVAIQPDDKAVIGGNFAVAGGVARNALVRLNTNATVDLFPKDISLGDFNADGLSDLVVANFNTDVVSVLMGNGDGTFRPATTFAAGDGADYLAVGDFNSDSRPAPIRLFRSICHMRSRAWTYPSAK